jgi:Fe-S-cluster-containing dehydrogenase component/DMSO reductase anchor subunit
MTTTVAPTSGAHLALTPAPAEKRRLPLVDQYLRTQQSLTAVERFSQRHADRERPALEGRYRDLLPATPPSSGQQYAFEVDLDACTGCKACVAACHSLNGLAENEVWRAVGLLHGGTSRNAVQQHVTTACHHCLDPACMNGCPVMAYEKDPVTGIVKHLDDQCIGCQYCTFTCPYDVPQYNVSKGIVRKCDMCSDRLAVGEAPACAQACPNDAIAITIVERRQVLEDAQGNAFVPGAPSPGITAPTTVYKTERALPRNLLPANFYQVHPAHNHAPLVAMLVLTQLSVGAFCIDAFGSRWLPGDVQTELGPIHAVSALVVGLAALGASILHLGRPLFAFRAVLGLRTSWMSREILAFGLFANAAMLYAASFWLPLLAFAHPILRVAVAVSGLTGVFCSVMIYQATHRPWWSASRTGFKFLFTTLVLGLAAAVALLAVGAAMSAAPSSRVALSSLSVGAIQGLIVAGTLKGAGELVAFRHLRDKQYSALRRSAHLMAEDLRPYTLARFGALVLALLGCAIQLAHPLSIVGGSVILLLFVVGELLERTLFFAASSSPAMPGGLS